MTNVGDKTICRTCNGVLVAIKDPTVISLTAGLWVHDGFFGRLRDARHTPAPWRQS